MRWSGAGNRFVINHSTAGKEHQPPVMSTGSSLSIHGPAKSSVQIYSNTTNNRSGVMNSDLILFPLDGAGGLSLSLLLSISLLNIIISGLQPSYSCEVGGQWRSRRRQIIRSDAICQFHAHFYSITTLEMMIISLRKYPFDLIPHIFYPSRPTYSYNVIIKIYSAMKYIFILVE